jgi:3-phenylpropionate/trans-cinnamate dioxygenase ferredoxin reductase subunit
VSPIVVVGASLAGLSAAHSMRSAGYEGELVVLDASDELPVDRPPLSKQVLSGEWDLARAQQPMARHLGELGLDLRLSSAAAGFDADRREVRLADGSRIEAAGAVLATGAVPRRLPGPARPGLHVLRSGADARGLRAGIEGRPSRVVVVGAGFIGAEVAATCRGLGLEVTMVEAGEAPLVRALPIEVGRFVAELHRRHGVDLRLGTGISEVVGGEGDRVRSVRLDDGTDLDCDLVVLGIGVAPSVSWLESSGIPVLEASKGGGVRCDASLRAAPGVVAAGDLAAWPNPAFDGELMRVEHWESAIDQGAHAGRRLLAELDECPMPDPTYASLPWFWSDQYDAKIQMVGRAGPDDEVVVVDGRIDGERFVALLRRGDECRAVIGVNRPRLVMQARMRMVESRRWTDVVELFG